MTYQVSLFDSEKQVFVQQHYSNRTLAHRGLTIAGRAVVDADGCVIGFVQATQDAGRTVSG